MMDRAAALLSLFLLVPASLLAGDPAGEKPKNREESLRAVCAVLGIGEGKTVADVGCGGGGDSFVFAAIVGPKGTVLSEEIGDVRKVLDGARERKLENLSPILGDTGNPRLPDGSADLIYLHYVFHHLADPASMLRHMWLDLKPGGFLVIVENGPPVTREWVPLEEREKKHQPVGETLVVRRAREAGFLFHDVLAGSWSNERDFILAFRKPPGLDEPAGDRDLPPPLDAARIADVLPASPVAGRPPCALVAALDGGRAALPAVASRLGPGARILDLVLEEWPMDRDESPAVPAGVAAETVRVRRGGLELPGDPAVDLVVFADSYHRLWEAAPLLARVHRSLAPGGNVVIVDRAGPAGEDRRRAGHRRRISPEAVKAEMDRAGFDLAGQAPAPGEGRFALTFRPRAGRRWI